MSQILLGYYGLLTLILLVLVVLVDEHQFRKVFVKHTDDKNDTEEEVSEQLKRISLINEDEYGDDEQSERKRKQDCEGIIGCRNISKKKKGSKNEHVVKDITFGVERGQIMGLLGPSGAGKSTIFKLLTLMSARDSGVLNLAGIEINRYWKDYRHSQDLDLGFVF
jgi:ABC-type bacteriocin/lantibiotic exporter with double-glycine peptidase domain